MKTILTLLFVVFLALPAGGQIVQKPEWVKQFQEGKGPLDATDYYVGVGSSKTTQDEANARARQEFGLNVEAHVQTVITREIQETEKRLTDEYSSSARVVSDVVFRGISVTERFEDKDDNAFYALIKIQKSVYDTLLVNEIRRDLERKKAENRVREEKRAEELRSLQAELDLKKKEEETRRLEIETERKVYEEFFRQRPPGQVVDARNAEIAKELNTVGMRFGLSPFAIQSGYYILSLSRFEVSAQAYFQEKVLQREQAAIKIQMLEQAGEFYKTSLAFGVLGYGEASSLKALDTTKPKYSFLLTGNVALPNAWYSYASFHVDGSKLSIGIINYPLQRHFKEAISLVLQMDYVWNKDWRNRFGDALMVQGGIRFRASDTFSTSFCYENHESIVCSIEMAI